MATPEGVTEALDGIFPVEEIKGIMQKALTPEYKKRVIDLTTSTKAFGAPWIVAVNGDGEKKEYFGNDRWDQVFYHLGVPYTPISIIPPHDVKSKL